MPPIKFIHNLTHLLTSIGFLDLQKKPNITNTMQLVQNSTRTKQTSRIGPHGSHSGFFLLPYNRLTLTVLSPYSMTLALHDQNKLQYKHNMWLINLFCLLYDSSSSLHSLQNKVPSLITTFPPITLFLAIKCMLNKINITHGLFFALLIIFSIFSLL